MSTHDRARDQRDELASRLLDGELPEDEAAAARRDPAVVARMEELAEVRARLREVPPLPAAAQTGTLAAALDAFDDDAGAVTGAQVTAIGAGRGRRRRMPRWLGAAAAAIAVVAGVAGLAALAGQRSGGDQSTAGGSTEAQSSGDASQGSGAEDSASGGGGAPLPVVDLGDIGDIGSVDQLRGLVAQQMEAAAAPGAARALGDDEADATTFLSQSCDRSDEAELQGRGRLDGRDVEFWVVADEDGRRLLVVAAGCDVVADERLP